MEITEREARRYSYAIADISCFMLGYLAAQDDDSEISWLKDSISKLKELNRKLKDNFTDNI